MVVPQLTSSLKDKRMRIVLLGVCMVRKVKI
jgi:hypothetical protein